MNTKLKCGVDIYSMEHLQTYVELKVTHKNDDIKHLMFNKEDFLIFVAWFNAEAKRITNEIAVEDAEYLERKLQYIRTQK